MRYPVVLAWYTRPQVSSSRGTTVVSGLQFTKPLHSVHWGTMWRLGVSASELECGTLGKECTLWGFGKILGMVEKKKLVMMTLHVPDVWKENSKTSHGAAPRLANWIQEKGVCEEPMCNPGCGHSDWQDRLTTVMNRGQHQGTSLGQHRPTEGSFPGDGM